MQKMLSFKKLLTILGLILACIGCSSSGGGGGSADEGSVGISSDGGSSAASDIPLLGSWQENMVHFGRQHCDPANLKELGTWEGSVWYYDGIRVYYQIADYTGDASWNACARYVRDIYRPYVLANGGKVPGWRVFPHGLFEDYLRTGDAESKRAVELLATSSVFASAGGGSDFEMSRETAYLIHAYIAAEDLGIGRYPQLAKSVGFALSHLEQWRSGKASYVKPFMVGLTLEALINYVEHFPDRRVETAIVETVDWLWRAAWSESQGKFPYITCQSWSQHQECFEDHSAEGADLHLLIAPAYAWAYRHSGEGRFRERGDRIFESGVRGAWLAGGKQFSQSYRWSFDYVHWRR